MSNLLYCRLTTVLRTDRVRVSRFRLNSEVRNVFERQNAQHLVACPPNRYLRRTEMGKNSSLHGSPTQETPLNPHKL